MATPQETSNKPSLPWPLIAVACVIAVIGIGFLISAKVQQSDPTLTQAPPPGPHAQVLQSPPGKPRGPQRTIPLLVPAPK